MNNIKITVIVPIYNMEQYLVACLDSIFCQSLTNMEVLCIDDGSTDGTLAILANYEKKHSNLRVYHQERKGAGAARNLGIANANGKYVSFMDSDDYFPSCDVLEALYIFAEENGINMTGGSLYRVVNGMKQNHQDSQMRNVRTEIVTSCDYQYPFGFYRFIYKTEMLIKNNIMFPNFVRFQDPPFMLNAIIASKHIGLIPVEAYAYREFDKKIEFTSTKVVTDMVNAYLYMMIKSRENGFRNVQKKILEIVQGNEEILLLHINSGNEQVYDIISEISNNIMDKEVRDIFIAQWNADNIRNKFDSYFSEAEKVRKLATESGKVLIYGAGRIGKELYDYVSSMREVVFLGFVVTKNVVESTARGHVVRSIYDIGSEDKDALVIIAVKEDTNGNMWDTATELGFDNKLYVHNKIGYIGMNLITNGKFSYDN